MYREHTRAKEVERLYAGRNKKPAFAGSPSKAQQRQLMAEARQVIAAKGLQVGVEVVFEDDHLPVGKISAVNNDLGQVKVGRRWYNPRVLAVHA